MNPLIACFGTRWNVNFTSLAVTGSLFWKKALSTSSSVHVFASSCVHLFARAGTKLKLGSSSINVCRSIVSLNIRSSLLHSRRQEFGVTHRAVRCFVSVTGRLDLPVDHDDQGSPQKRSRCVLASRAPPHRHRRCGVHSATHP